MIDRYLQRHVKLIHTGELYGGGSFSQEHPPYLFLFSPIPSDIISWLYKYRCDFKIAICAFPEERNYICDQCGQTFKQRKHLSVHQMRHSGAKPLQ